MVLTFESVDKIRKCCIQRKVTEQYFPVVCGFVMLYMQLLTFESFNILNSDHANEKLLPSNHLPVVLFIVLSR